MSGWVDGWMGEDRQTILATKILIFSSGVDARIVDTNTESSLFRCWSQLVAAGRSWLQMEEACKDIVTAVLAYKIVTFWKRVEQVESEWIPCNCDNYVLILDCMPKFFGGFFFRPKAQLLVIRSQVEPGLIKGHNESPCMMFDGTEFAEQLIYQNEMAGFLSIYETLGKPSKMLHNKPKRLC
jgi:hypothetical protein